jgi:hypothetical protein
MVIKKKEQEMEMMVEKVKMTMHQTMIKKKMVRTLKKNNKKVR